MPTEAPMKRVGLFAGQPLYYADRTFEVPGFYYWNGTKNEFVGATGGEVEDAAKLRNYRVEWANTNVFKDTPDSRQSERIDEPVTRFRPRYRALTAPEKTLHDEIKDAAARLLALYASIEPSPAGTKQDHAHLPPSVSGRYLSLATTELESSVMWAIKALTLPRDVQD